MPCWPKEAIEAVRLSKQVELAQRCGMQIQRQRPPVPPLERLLGDAIGEALERASHVDACRTYRPATSPATRRLAPTRPASLRSGSRPGATPGPPSGGI